MMKLSILKRMFLLGSLFAILLAAGAGAYYVKASGMLSPGQISATHPKNQPLNGYVSHAEFEHECSHCHAPVHCITDTRCQDCHMEIAEQRLEGDGLHGLLPGTSRCQTCHIEHQGREVVISQFAYPNVDHMALTGFSLARHKVDYQNEPMGCQSCHSGDRFIHETLDCLTCHVQNDHDYMAEHLELFGADCLSCHDGVDRMGEFDHNAYYPLDGAHLTAECTQCHANLVYAGTQQECKACHEDRLMVADQFGDQCERCHTTTAWLPAQLIRHDFIVNHGENPADNCLVCHVETMIVYDCYGCHDVHQAEEMERLHLVNGLTDYYEKSCIECHPTGAHGEAAAITGKSFDLSSYQPDSGSGSNQ